MIAVSDERTTDRPAEPHHHIPPVPPRSIAFEGSCGPDWGRRIAWAFAVSAAVWTFVANGLDSPRGEDPMMSRLREYSAVALALVVPLLVGLYLVCRRRGGEVPDDPRPQSERDED